MDLTQIITIRLRGQSNRQVGVEYFGLLKASIGRVVTYFQTNLFPQMIANNGRRYPHVERFSAGTISRYCDFVGDEIQELLLNP